MGGRRMSSDSAVSYVAQSAVRTAVLLELAGDRMVTEELLDEVDASESAVYNALSALQRRGLVRSLGDRWEVTGRGRLVADAIEEQAALDRLLDHEYWETHDASVLPRQFRHRMSDLEDATVIEASDTDPYGVVRDVRERLEQTEHAHVITQIYQPDYVEAMPDTADSQLLLDWSIIEETVGDPDGDPIETDEVRIFDETKSRLLDAEFTITVTDSEVILSLPTLDGRYDSRTSVVCADEAAHAWGRDLFEHYWQQATPVEAALADLDIDFGEPKN